MNTDEIISVMETLQTPGSACPYCSLSLPKHDTECVFVDFILIQLMLEAHVSPSVNPEGLKDILYGFIKDRSHKKYFLDAVCYTLTKEVLEKELGIYENDTREMINRIHPYIWSYHIVMRYLRREPFFRVKDKFSKERSLKALTAIDIIQDIKASRLGMYEYSETTRKQVSFLSSLSFFIRSWSRGL